MLRKLSCFLLLTFSVSVFSQNGIPGLTTNTLQPIPTNLPMDLIQAMGGYVYQNYSDVLPNTSVVLSWAPLDMFVISPAAGNGFTISNIIKKNNPVTPQITYGFTNTDAGTLLTSLSYKPEDDPNTLTFSYPQSQNGIAITSTPLTEAEIQKSSLAIQLENTPPGDGDNFSYTQIDSTTPDGVKLKPKSFYPYVQNSANLLVFPAQTSNKLLGVDKFSGVDASRSDRPITQDASGITNVMNGHE